MSIRFFQVDAFAAEPFAGNPAAVCLLDVEPSEEWMGLVAREMNLSETAFVRRLDARTHALRWFTPAVEVDLCGHATLASAHVLWEVGDMPGDSDVRFETRCGLLTARNRGKAIVLDFPSESSAPTDMPDGLESALGVTPRAVERNRFDLIVELASEAEVRRLAPDLGGLAEIAARGIIVTARAETVPYDFISRFFGPRVGVDEDPVTGSAHCALAPYWASRLGKSVLTGYQASARGGRVDVEVIGDRVLLGGRAVTVMHGTML